MSIHPIGELGDRPESSGTDSQPAMRQDVLASDKARLANQVSGIQYNYFGEVGTQTEPVVSIAPPLGQRDERLPLRGRERLLTILTDTHGANKVQVIHGMGGCGKTRLAIELAWQAQQQGVEVWWVSATDKARLVAGMRAVGHRLGISDDELRRGEAADLVWQSIANRKKEWLLVIDAADDSQILAAPGAPVGHGTGWLRPPSSATGSVVVTSRDGRKENWGPWCTFHLVEMLAAHEAARVLMDHTGGNEQLGSEEDALGLAKRLGGLALALKIAGSFLAESVAVPTAFSSPRLFRTYNDYRQAIEHGRLDTAFPVPAAGITELTAEQARGLIGQTWELTLDSLQARQMPEARRALRLLASLADAPIPYIVLLKPDILSNSTLFENITGHRLWHVLKTLAGFGLIDLATDDDTLSLIRLHPLVRDTSRPRSDDDPDECDTYLTLAAKLIRQAAQDVGSPKDPATWPMWQLLSPHSLYVFESLNFVEGNSTDNLALAAYAAEMATRYQVEQGLSRSAQKVYQSVLTVYVNTLGVDHPNTLATRHHIGLEMSAQGDHEGAIAELNDVLAARIRLLGLDHPDTLETRHDIAMVIEEQGDHQAAEAELRDVLAARLRVLGPDHRDTLETRHSIAYVMSEQGDRAEVEAALRDILADRLRLLGAEHPDTLATRHNLACEIAQQGNYLEAEAEFRDVLTAKLRVRGNEHPSTLITRMQIAFQLANQGKHAEAEAEYRQVLAVRERVLGAEDSDTLTAWYQVAWELAAQGKHAEAEAGYRQVLAGRERVLGAEHSDTLTTWYQVAWELAAQEKHAEAEAEYRQVLAGLRNSLGAEHSDTLTTWYQVAGELAAQEKHAEAEAEYRQVLAAEQRVLGAEHRDTLTTSYQVAGELAAQEKHAEAEAEYRQVLAGLRNSLGAEHSDTLTTWYQVAGELAAQEKHAEAEAEYRQVLAGLRNSLGAEHSDTLTTWYQVAGELAAQEKHAEAEAEYRQVLAAEQRVLGAEHRDTLTTSYQVAGELAAQEKHAEAEAEYRQVLAARERVLGAEHRDTLSTWYQVAWELAAQEKHAEAEAEYRQVLAGLRNSLGAEHSDTLSTWYQVAWELAAQEKHAEAEAEYRQVLAGLRNSLGAEHSDTLTTWYQVAGELAAQEKHAEAEAEYRQVLAARERVLGAEHNSTLGTRKDLATLLVELGRQLLYPSMRQSPTMRGANTTMENSTKSEIEQALDHFKEALSLVDAEKDPGYYGVILHDIAATHKAMGNLEEAAEAYQEAVIYKRKRLPDSPGDLATTMEAYSDFLIEHGNLAEARIILNQLTELLPQVLPPTRRAVHIHAAGKGFEKLGERGQEDAYDEALDAYKEAFSLINRDVDPASGATVLNDIGDIYQIQGKLEEARAAYKQAVDYMRLAPQHSKNLAYMLVDLARIERRLGNPNATAAEDEEED